jgi:hypothetical protein
MRRFFVSSFGPRPKYTVIPAQAGIHAEVA